jgi:hypothetical protein
MTSLFLETLYNLSYLRKIAVAVDPYRTYDRLDRGSKCRSRLFSRLAWILFQPCRQVPPLGYLLQLIVRRDLLNHLVAVLSKHSADVQ